MLASGNLSLLALPKTMFSGIDVFARKRCLLHPDCGVDDRRRLSGPLRFASQFVGRFRGGMGHTNILH
jgi:hypothetical protein